MSLTVRVDPAPFDTGAELTAFMAGQAGAGAVVSFTGITRDVAGGLQAMEIEHYPAMTEAALIEMGKTAMDRFSLSGALILHRYGTLRPADPIMMVATAAPHRRAAFEAADFLMDYLKSRAPFWKKEVTARGATWVEAKDDDEADLSRWT